MLLVDMKFMLNLHRTCYIWFIILSLASLNWVFAYVQGQSSSAPITSRVVPYNSSAFPLTNKLSEIEIPKLSIVVPHTSLTSPFTNTPSYTTTNTTFTFSSATLNGITSKQSRDSIVPSTSSIIKGVRR
jgi:hypothetical protein